MDSEQEYMYFWKKFQNDYPMSPSILGSPVMTPITASSHNSQIFFGFNFTMNEVAPPKYSKKVFIGGVPTGTQSIVLFHNFSAFGSHSIDWPKRTADCQGPPSGYAFLVFDSESSIEQLLNHCMTSEGRKIFELLTSKGLKHPVEVKVWELNNSCFMVDGCEAFNRYSVFVGGIPRTCTAVELAQAMEKVIAKVVFSCIELDRHTQYPKGAARVTFNSKEAYMKAIAAHKILLSFTGSLNENLDREVEVLPYLMPDVPCERCNSVIGTKFCNNVICLSYFCNACWKIAHGLHPYMQSHVPLKKTGKLNNVKPRGLSFDF